VVALVQPEHWTIGALVNNVWSVGGQRARPAVNQMVFQYFINYNGQRLVFRHVAGRHRELASFPR
jgi:hypothetical protein